jgi:hypothetical protein
MVRYNAQGHASVDTALGTAFAPFSSATRERSVTSTWLLVWRIHMRLKTRGRASWRHFGNGCVKRQDELQCDCFSRWLRFAPRIPSPNHRVWLRLQPRRLVRKSSIEPARECLRRLTSHQVCELARRVGLAMGCAEVTQVHFTELGSCDRRWSHTVPRSCLFGPRCGPVVYSFSAIVWCSGTKGTENS